METVKIARLQHGADDVTELYMSTPGRSLSDLDHLRPHTTYMRRFLVILASITRRHEKLWLANEDTYCH